MQRGNEVQGLALQDRDPTALQRQDIHRTQVSRHGLASPDRTDVRPEQWPDQPPGLDAARPGATGWRSKKVSLRKQTYAAAGLLRDAQRLQLKAGYFNTGDKTWKRIAPNDVDAEGLAGALDRLTNDIRACLAREGAVRRPAASQGTVS
ncbi:hypothetical protein [Stappia stellulata]|uniref:hypothetical protein n=1 Tax=Stappia stellulata TaxID=71235 RepID=UPI0012EC2260|nr:hypothetical protein [Stappia stellulata]